MHLGDLVQPKPAHCTHEDTAPLVGRAPVPSLAALELSTVGELVRTCGTYRSSEYKPKGRYRAGVSL